MSSWTAHSGGQQDPEGRKGPALPVHGGTDAGPPVQHDFSTNAHPLGAPPAVLDAVFAADRTRYPDPAYTALRARLGDWHGVAAWRVLPASGGAEAIRRLSLAALLDGVTRVCVPQPGFGDYRAAAEALGLEVVAYETPAGLAAAMDRPCLTWICDPCNPTGTTFSDADWAVVDDAQRRSNSRVVVDQAYEALRLRGASSLPDALASRLWRLVCPNKALGLTGIRAAYLLAPEDDDWRDRMVALASSWVLSAEGEALLGAWATADVQRDLHDSLALLRQWGEEQQQQLAGWGFDVVDSSVANFWLARLPDLAPHPELELGGALDLDLELSVGPVAALHDAATPVLASPGAQATRTPSPAESGAPTTPAGLLAALRTHGIKLRDATSFQRPGHVRVSVQSPEAVQALVSALYRVLGPYGPGRSRGAPGTGTNLGDDSGIRHQPSGPEKSP